MQSDASSLPVTSTYLPSGQSRQTALPVTSEYVFTLQSAQSEASSLPEFYKERLLAWSDRRITTEGVVVIKAQRFRTQEKNLDDALARLKALILDATVEQKKRKPTKPSKAAKRKRMDKKTRHGQTKALRKPPTDG